MKLSDHQAKFAHQSALLIQFAFAKGFRVRFGQAHRSDEEQARLRAAGKSKIRRSVHQDRLGLDLILDKWNGTRWVYQRTSAAYEELGDFWEDLDPHNEWGGRWQNFPDGNHFERNRSA